MKSVLFVLVGLSLVGTTSWAQDARSDSVRTSVYVEFLGNAGLYSINYERLVADNIAVRVGFGTWKSDDFFASGSSRITTFPFMASYLVGKRNSKLEIGAGFLFGKNSLDSSFGSENDGSSTIIDFIAVFGYRLQNRRARRIFRIGVTPFFPIKGIYPDEVALVSIGFGGGLMF